MARGLGWTKQESSMDVDYYQFTPREKIFCKAYLSNGFRIADAAIKAGYGKGNPDYARNIGWNKLHKAHHIKAYLRREIKKMEEKLGVSFEERTSLLWKTAKRAYGPTDEEAEALKRGDKVNVPFDFNPAEVRANVAELTKMFGDYPKDNGSNAAAQKEAEKVATLLEEVQAEHEQMLKEID